MFHLFLRRSEELEYCFNVETSAPLDVKELAVLRQILADGFVSESISAKPTHPEGRDVVELGPRMNFATAYSTNIVAICQTCGLEKVTRIECSRRYYLPEEVDKERFIREHHDRMTECVYDHPLETFESGIQPEPVFEVPFNYFSSPFPIFPSPIFHNKSMISRWILPNCAIPRWNP